MYDSNLPSTPRANRPGLEQGQAHRSKAAAAARPMARLNSARSRVRLSNGSLAWISHTWRPLVLECNQANVIA